MEKSDINEIIKAAVGSLDLSQFKGDVVMYKHVDKEMNIADGGIGEQHIHHHHGEKEEVKADSEGVAQTGITPAQQGAGVQEKLFKYIDPNITNDAQREHIHKVVKNLVRDRSVAEICDYLKEMRNKRELLLPPKPKPVFEELQRMGMPGEDVVGFGYKNFEKSYKY